MHGTDKYGNWKSGPLVTQAEFDILPVGGFYVMEKDSGTLWTKKMSQKSPWVEITVCSKEEASGRSPAVKASPIPVTQVTVKSTPVVSKPPTPATVATKPIVAAHSGGVVKKSQPPAVATSSRGQNMPQVSVNIDGTNYHARVVDSAEVLMKVRVRFLTYVGLTTDNMSTVKVYKCEPGVALDLDSPVKTLRRQVKPTIPASV